MGGYDSDGNKDPYMIVFVYKTGFKNSVDGKNFKPLRKNSKENHSPAVLYSHASNEAESMCSDSSDDTLRMCAEPFQGVRFEKMAIPKYNELYSLFLFAIQDGAPHSSKDVKKIISQKLQLTALLLNW